jgi:hypothetical protein
MAYGRQAVMDALRDAGARLNNFDQMYADKVKSAVYGDDPRGAKGWVGDFLGGRYNDVEVNSELLGSAPFGVRAATRGMQFAVPAVGYTARYGLPAAGVTLAGKGLFDLTQGLYAMASETPVFGGPEDGQQPGQLPLQ